MQQGSNASGSPPTTLGAYAAYWLAGRTRRAKARTRETYENNLRLHLLPALGADTPLASITRAQIRDLLFAKLDAGYAVGTILLMLKVVRGLLTTACLEDELIHRNPALGLSRVLPRRKKVQAQRAIRRQSLRGFLAAARAIHPALSVLFLVAARAGLRLGELLGLQWDDVDLARRTITIARTIDWRGRVGPPKGNRSAVLPLSPQATEALRELRAHGANGCVWVFHSASGRGRPWSRTHVWRIMDRACERAGIPHASAHALRHSFITHVAEVADTPWEVRDLARHSSITETEPYLHLNLRYRGSIDALDD